MKRARAKQLQPDEYNSGTFTISNLGMYGVESFDAILPPGGWTRWGVHGGFAEGWQRGSPVAGVRLGCGQVMSASGIWWGWLWSCGVMLGGGSWER